MNKCVFSWVLKVERLFAVRTPRGSAFHKVGAAAANARSPLDFKKERGTSNTARLADLRALEGWWIVTRSARYFGASPFRDLKTNRRILKLIA